MGVRTTRRGHSRSWRTVATLALVLGGLLAFSDWAAGRWQEHLIQHRKDFRARLDRLAFLAVRTGIDEIRYEPESRYRVRLRIQNAYAEPLYVMMPTVEAFIQVGPTWASIPVAEPPEAAGEGTVVRLVGEKTTERVLAIEQTDYTELMPGYIHLKMTLEAYVSPEENPEEEIGERKEDLFVYLKDYRLAQDAARHGGQPSFAEKPDFIPLRAWTLVPSEALPK